MLLRGPRRRSHQSIGHQGMISEIDTSSVVDETESTKVTTESQMAENRLKYHHQIFTVTRLVKSSDESTTAALKCTAAHGRRFNRV